MTRRERIQFICVWVALGILPLFLRPLWEPDEIRYAEIPREMLATGDWMTPTLNFVSYFEKPPLQYWLSAFSMKLFGISDVAARLPLALASFLSMISAYRLAQRLGSIRPLWAAFMAASSLLVFVCNQILILDALFTAWVLIAFLSFTEAVAARYSGQKHLGWELGAYAAMGLALLTKGLAVLVILGGIFSFSILYAIRHRLLLRSVFKTFLNPLGWTFFLLISAPWFIWMEKNHPGHSAFFFIHEHFQRFSSHVHQRQASDYFVLDKLFFLGVLSLGLVPWFSTCVMGFKRGIQVLRRSSGPMGPMWPLQRWLFACTLLSVVFPLFFFTLSGSKLAPYILPCCVPLMALASSLEQEGEEVKSLRRHGFELLFLGFGFCGLAPLLIKNVSALPFLLILGIGFLLLGAWTFKPIYLTSNIWMASLSSLMLLLTFTAQKSVGSEKNNIHLVQKAPQDAAWISVGYNYQVIPWLTQRRVVVVAGEGELAFGRNRLTSGEQRRWFEDDIRALNRVADRLIEEGSSEVWALAARGAWTALDPNSQAKWDIIESNRKILLIRYRA